MGFTSGTQIIIGRRNGEHHYDKIGNLFYQGFYFVVFFSAFLFGFIQLVIPDILSAIFESENIIHFSQVYIKTRGYGIFFTLINLLFISFFVGITKTRILGIFTPLIAGLNIILDLAFINGFEMIPAMGVEGAALASVISEAIGSVFFLIYMWRFVDLKKYGLLRFISFSWEKTITILQVSSPIMLQNAISIGAWFTFFIFVENLGERALAISQIVRGIYMFVMVPIFSLGDATNTFVSNLMGEKHFGKIMPLIVKASGLGILVNALFFIGINLFPEFTLGIFTPDPIITSEAIPTLRLTTVSMFLFTLAFVPFRGISGTGNTKTALVIESTSILVYLLYTYYVAVVLKLELYMVWSSEFVYFGMLMIISYLYLIYGNWKSRKI
jgi:putative MATE family efflux protein